ncbi:hypothetical protein HELRODRAFT_164210 [Helobdella robusta]|uniref:Uncharacterized protein n=1 Tax=Helobdella robusta TaxID=6412 RepID=T1EV37_HELRO|nr:hypothetical protein HELRODRAFT_164210 [Helobdella robusta]ESN94377.1 hypothetical protein HELRODRAFT_164210 [Helobdella robusta]
MPMFSSMASLNPVEFIQKHSWRCTKNTANFNVNTVHSPANSNVDISANIFNSNTANNYSVNMDNNNLIQRCCGRFCKDRKGLKMHQRSCKTHKQLPLTNDEENAVETSTPTTPPPSPSSDVQQQPTTTSHQTLENVENTETPLLGIRLPRSLAQWLEANAYFQLHQSTLPNLTNLNEFTIGFQTMIYNYFASNFGTINNKIKSDGGTKTSIKLLKKELKQLKFLGRNNHHFDNQIKSVSKTLRSKLSSSKSSDSTKQHNTTSQLKRRFWWFCKKDFYSTTSLSPSYSVTVCKNYFHSILSDTHNNKQQLPNWIPKLSTPPTPCNTDPPSYNEISKIIRKYKSRSSPCPLDQISIIPFKKCPILRTIFHRLLIQCTSSKMFLLCVMGELCKPSSSSDIFEKEFTSSFSFCKCLRALFDILNSRLTTTKKNNKKFTQL